MPTSQQQEIMKKGEQWRLGYQTGYAEKSAELTAFSERLKWYLDNLKNAQGESQKNTAIASVIDYLEAFFNK